MKTYGRYIPLFLSLLVLQLVLFFLYSMEYRENGWNFVLIGLGLLALGILVDVIILYLFKWILQKVELEERLAEYYAQRRHEWEYDSLRWGHINEMQELSGQYEKQINSICEMLEQDTISSERKEAARELLRKLEGEIAGSRMVKYSDNHIINAVFTAKAARCTEKGITLQVQCDLGEKLCSDEIDICSITDNLLDVAIEKWNYLSAEERYVFVKIVQRSDRLIFKLEMRLQSAAETDREKLTGNLKKKLWCRELELVQHICEKNKGYMEIAQQDGWGVISVVI